MTNNQLQFQKNAEARRHNLEMEREQEFANTSDRLKAQASLSQAGAAQIQAAVASAKQQEEARHNLETERQGSQKLVLQGVDTGTNAISAFGRAASVLATTMY